MVTWRSFAALTVSRIVVVSPAWKPQAMFADETKSRSASSWAARELPKPSPRSAFRSIVRGNRLLLAAFLPAGNRLRFDDLPFLYVVLEAAAPNFWKQLLAHDHGREPVGISIVRFDGQPGELRAHALVANLAPRISLTLPLHGCSPSLSVWFKRGPRAPSHPPARRNWHSSRTYR